ncbi:MAG: hypothetical protein EOO42_22510, partial [Flavobacteriales bacterium]
MKLKEHLLILFNANLSTELVKLKLTFSKVYNYLGSHINTDFSIPYFLDKTYFPSLNGWRAIAISLVILGHSKFVYDHDSTFYKFAEIFIYAELGVRIFFILSGFLITSLLIKQSILWI